MHGAERIEEGRCRSRRGVYFLVMTEAGILQHAQALLDELLHLRRVVDAAKPGGVQIGTELFFIRVRASAARGFVGWRIHPARKAMARGWVNDTNVSSR